MGCYCLKLVWNRGDEVGDATNPRTGEKIELFVAEDEANEAKKKAELEAKNEYDINQLELAHERHYIKLKKNY